MAAMDLIIGATVVGKVLNYKPLYKSQKVLSTALNGSAYIQKTGNRIRKYEMDVFCSTAIKRANLDAACYNCDEVSFYTRDGFELISGFIEDDEIDWKEWTDGHGVGHFIIVKE